MSSSTPSRTRHIREFMKLPLDGCLVPRLESLLNGWLRSTTSHQRSTLVHSGNSFAVIFFSGKLVSRMATSVRRT
ncbi:hypothetical protein CC2G_008314 [Coprinopsis cinerea AmutBmut pab1-1]|nr:hypothetical protein CC2G_008314 [Coprinopsis cinerea AmutBmut pab1-1]